MVKSANNSKGTPKIYLNHLEMFLKIEKNRHELRNNA